MALIVSLKAEDNRTMADIDNVYIRIDSLMFYPKQKAIHFQVVGYINKQSGQIMKKKENDMVKKLEGFFGAKNIYSGKDAKEVFTPENLGVPNQIINEPTHIFRDKYNIFLKPLDDRHKKLFENISVWDDEAMFNATYQILKEHEPRFLNIRDDLEDDQQN